MCPSITAFVGDEDALLVQHDSCCRETMGFYRAYPGAKNTHHEASKYIIAVVRDVDFMVVRRTVRC